MKLALGEMKTESKSYHHPLKFSEQKILIESKYFGFRQPKTSIL